MCLKVTTDLKTKCDEDGIVFVALFFFSKLIRVNGVGTPLTYAPSRTGTQLCNGVCASAP